MCILHRKKHQKKEGVRRSWRSRRRRIGAQGSLEVIMALNYPSCSFLVSDECSALMRGCGCWSEEASPLSSPGVNSRRWDDFEPDPADLLPVDPFGMNLGNTITAAIASCLDRTVMSGAGRFGSSDGGAADLSFYLNHAIAVSRGPSCLPGGFGRAFEGPFVFGGLYEAGGANCSQGLPPLVSCSGSIVPGEDPSTSGSAALLCREGVDAVAASCSRPIVPGEDPSTSGSAALVCCDGVDAVGASCSRPIVPGEDPSTSGSAALVCCDGVDDVGSAPHDGMMYALAYLGLRDILATEMVCKSLHSWIRSELSWKCIHIEPVLSGKISDPDLLFLTQKIPGALQCLNINDCINITDNGLNAVLQSNPTLTKLSIARCPRLTLDGLIANLKSFNMKAVSGIKSLRIDKNFNLPKEDYEELLSLLSIDKRQELHNWAPRFRHSNHFLLDCNDGYALDIEMCPICQSYKLVFDCPEVECSDKRSGKCRACEVCIKRCRQCGRCLERNEKFEEKFDLVYLCYKCRGDPASPSLGVEKDLVSILSSGRIASP
ncbi:F-box protein SKIP14-like isoform X2 [Triticum dicoccoides]|uniref:F-box protein SKIP14-like isoform X2 n=1 Tax=Triticum dicoccoides TaxID=85692 RepID=UPI00188F5F9A|nr:F-box protein SKIP14-like isoform X2 [Triticum dicoccoides]